MEEEDPGEVGRGEADVPGVLVASQGPEQLGEVHEGTLQPLVLGTARRKRVDDVERRRRGSSEGRDGLNRRSGDGRGSWGGGPSGCGSMGRGAHCCMRRCRDRNRGQGGDRSRRWDRRVREGRFRSVLGSSRRRQRLRRLVLSGSPIDRLRGDGLGGGRGPGRIARGRLGIASHRHLLGGCPPGVDVPADALIRVAGTLVGLRLVVAGGPVPTGLLRRRPAVGLGDQLQRRRLDRLLGRQLGPGVEAEAAVLPAQGLEDDVLALSGRTGRVEEMAEEEVKRGGTTLALQGQGTGRALCLHGLEQGCQVRFLQRALSLHRPFSVWE